MMVISAFRRELLALLREKSGNFAIITAILLPVSIGVVGVGMDVNSMVQNKRTLQNAVDAAALATATAMSNSLSTSDADAMAKSFVTSQMANISSGTTSSSAGLSTTATITTTTNSNSGNDYNVALSSSYTMAMNPLSSALGWKIVTITASGKAASSTQASQRGISLYLVLDRSGSMSFVTDQVDTSQSYCQNYTSDNWDNYPNLPSNRPCYINKITSLKTAVSTMSTVLNQSDSTSKSNSTPHSKLVRVGAVAFNDQTFTEKAVDWGPQSALSYVNDIPDFPTGGTDASAALTKAYDALKSSSTTEKTAFASNSITKFDRYVIFMTDGEMTGNSSDWNSSLDTKASDACNKIKSDGIQIFSVAFMAPAKGKTLLQKCATSSANYYQPDTMAGIVAAFGDIAKKAASGVTRLTN